MKLWLWTKYIWYELSIWKDLVYFMFEKIRFHSHSFKCVVNSTWVQNIPTVLFVVFKGINNDFDSCAVLLGFQPVPFWSHERNFGFVEFGSLLFSLSESNIQLEKFSTVIVMCTQINRSNRLIDSQIEIIFCPEMCKSHRKKLVICLFLHIERNVQPLSIKLQISFG